MSNIKCYTLCPLAIGRWTLDTALNTIKIHNKPWLDNSLEKRVRKKEKSKKKNADPEINSG